MQKRKLKNIHLSKLITFFIIIAFVLAIGKLIYISLARNIDGIDLKEYAEKRNTTKKILYAHRGTIYDSSGNYLATTVNSYTLIAYLSASRTINPDKPQHVVDKETTAKKLSELFIENGYKDMTYDYILERLNSTNKYQVEFAYAKDITETLKLEIEKLDLPGLDFVVSSKRYYQMGDFASYIVGYSRKNADGDIAGEMGIEKYYNDELKGENGFSEYQTDNYGYKLPYAEENLKYNDCYKYAVARNILYENKKDIELLVDYEPKLHYFIEWWKQLYGESEGKDLKGIFPAGVEFTTDLHSMGQYIQQGRRNLFETVLNVEKSKTDIKIETDEDNLDGLNYLVGKTLDYVNKKAMEATIAAHVDGDVPNILITMEKLDEENLGQLIYFFELACAMSGKLLGVNPFNQPGVEAYKKNMFTLLGKPGYEK